MDFPIIFIIIVLIAILLTYFIVVSFSKRKEEKRIPNYRALFIIGISWFPIGIATHNPGLWTVGIVFFIIGLANKDKWGKETKWSELPSNIRRFKITIIVILIIFLLIAFGYFIFRTN